jgi:hypothetical protein
MSSGVACRAGALCEGWETSLIVKINSKRFLDFARNDKIEDGQTGLDYRAMCYCPLARMNK